MVSDCLCGLMVSCSLQLDVLFGNLTEMVEFQVEFLKTLEDGTRLVPDLEKLERVDQFKVAPPSWNTSPHQMTVDKTSGILRGIHNWKSMGFQTISKQNHI